ncbi:MAG: hypothetical protein IPI59_15245 [Sphingobacteriales bacterium]|jgi:RNA polymerase sigma factor (sigma-70 family)|nr:hypothetical protein [Sphingobacteriales bacterium]MBP9140621.1 hypothetical protein [Chitinophagales bacterium]MDA0199212.1 sigma factor [Bacteroidota bacterium]MBK6888639.1 hypothetical protein [Sphingobacteriales bacterium]MBK7528851.1 hypothetical protein [Sphingobacteriales bacterium]
MPAPNQSSLVATLLEQYNFEIRLKVQRIFGKNGYKIANLTPYIEQAQTQFEAKLSKLLPELANMKVRHKYAVTDLLKNVCNNIEDTYLLQNNHPYLIEKYHYQTLTVVRKHLATQTQLSLTENDIAESITARLIEKLMLGALKNFKGENAWFRTYLYRITNNLVIDELRAAQRRIVTTELSETTAHTIAETPTYNYQIAQNHADLFEKAVKLFLSTPDRLKFKFCLRIEYRMVLQKADILSCYPNCPDSLLDDLLTDFGNDYTALKKGDLWQKLVVYLAQLSGKEEGIRTLQTWLDKQKLKIVEVLFKRSINISSLEQKQAIDAYLEELVYSENTKFN